MRGFPYVCRGTPLAQAAAQVGSTHARASGSFFESFTTDILRGENGMENLDWVEVIAIGMMNGLALAFS